MKIHDVKQGSGEWTALRLGRVTASEIDALVSPTGKVRVGDGPAKYLYRKVAEKFMGWSADSINTFDMTQGIVLENEARGWAMLEKNLDIRQVGFCESDDGRAGFSPDGLIGDTAGIEIKCPAPATHIGYLEQGCIPSDYILQVQFSLYISRRARWYFLSYNRYMPPLFVEVLPDEAIHTAIETALINFALRFDAIYERLKKHRDGDATENAEKLAAYYKSEGVTP